MDSTFGKHWGDKAASWKKCLHDWLLSKLTWHYHAWKITSKSQLGRENPKASDSRQPYVSSNHRPHMNSHGDEGNGKGNGLYMESARRHDTRSSYIISKPCWCWQILCWLIRWLVACHASCSKSCWKWGFCTNWKQQLPRPFFDIPQWSVGFQKAEIPWIWAAELSICVFSRK